MSPMLATIAAIMGFRVEEGRLFADAHVAQLKGTVLAMPPGTDHVVMEIGCSDTNTLDENLLPKDPKAFLVSFEPLLDKYSVLVSRMKGRHKDDAQLLGHHHPRGVVLPFAVDAKPGLRHFNVSQVAGCSSLLPMDPVAKWAGFCIKTLEERVVDVISLAQALRLTGSMPIHLLKIDAQGIDFAPVRAVYEEEPALLEKVYRIQMEVHHSLGRDKCKMLYPRLECPEVASIMRSIGYEGHCPARMKPWRCETDVIFERINSTLPRAANIAARADGAADVAGGAGASRMDESIRKELAEMQDWPAKDVLQWLDSAGQRALARHLSAEGRREVDDMLARRLREADALKSGLEKLRAQLELPRAGPG